VGFFVDKEWLPCYHKGMKRASEEKLKALAMDMADGKVFTDMSIREGDVSLLGMIFMPLLFLDEEQRVDLMEDTGMIYEYHDQAGPRGINGYPMFMSFHSVHRDDVETLLSLYRKALNLKREFLGLEKVKKKKHKKQFPAKDF
jgi:hypothetical protein